MSQIEELQGRITAALDRIGSGLEGLSSGADAALTQQLEEERLANAQLEERVRTLKARQEEEMATLQAGLSRQSEAMARLDMDLQRLRLANDQLRESSVALRNASEKGLADPELINKAMMAELEALRAAREIDVAEVGAVLSKLEPLLAAARPAGEAV